MKADLILPLSQKPLANEIFNLPTQVIQAEINNPEFTPRPKFKLNWTKPVYLNQLFPDVMVYLKCL